MGCPTSIDVSIKHQRLTLKQSATEHYSYSISTAKNGPGELMNSEKTPRGKHIIRAKIGAHVPINGVFIGRRFTGEIYTNDLAKDFPNRDWILTRILWLSGLEVGKNRLGNVDSMRRYIYIHGTPSSEPMGKPLSHGCIRMHNDDIIDLFTKTPIGCPITIT